MNVRRLAPLLCLALLGGVSAKAQAQDVEAGIRAYTQGNTREAIRQIATALDAGSLSQGSRARAHYFLGAAFLTLGDRESALPQINRALALYPCISPTADAPAGMAALYDENRPSGSICGGSAGGTILKSMLIPGWGQRSVGRPFMAFFVTTVSAAAGGVFMMSRGDDTYAEYQASTDPTKVSSLYSSAQTSRRIGLGLGGTAVAIYAWNVLDAAMAGRAHGREMARTRAVTARPVITAGMDGSASFAIKIPVR